MTWYDDQPVVTPPPAPEPAPSTPRPKGLGLRRGAIVAALGALLLVGGGVAAVSAASPEPSTDPSVVEPNATTQPDGPTPPDTDADHDGRDCPNEDGGSGSNGTDDGGSNSSNDSNSDSSSTQL